MRFIQSGVNNVVNRSKELFVLADRRSFYSVAAVLGFIDQWPNTQRVSDGKTSGY